ncbi:MAG: nucleotidyl transferase AbiEii/AbiGii toxin family protein [Proteobacteria bacterium]|nr:nucleotidyl transferase AbiEii/AbiGii toxin family protein [Pseudomonadota bacterium]
MSPPPQSVAPRLDILPPAQAALWRELSQAPATFTLYDGTALALQLGHRQSVDFDFFGAAFDPDELAKSLPFLASAEIVQRAPSTLTVRVDRGGPVLVSFFGVPELGRVRPPLSASDNGVLLANLVDIAGMKASVVQKRAAAKDYVDVAALIGAGITLGVALAAGRAIHGASFNPQITLKALSYFEDVGDLPSETKRLLQDAVRGVDVNAIPMLTAIGKIGGPA